MTVAMAALQRQPRPRRAITIIPHAGEFRILLIARPIIMIESSDVSSERLNLGWIDSP